jgi:hypothetical protein
MTTPRLIGLCGPARCGKDTTFEIIQKTRPDAIRVGLADFLKDVCSAVFNIQRTWFDDADKKEHPLHYPISLTAGKVHEVELIYAQRIGRKLWTARPELLNMLVYTPRQLLQVIGTDFLRTAEPNIHLDAVKLPEGLAVFTDCRFPNEVEWVKRKGGTVWYIERPEAETRMYTSSHISERGLKDLRYECDFLLQNRGSISELEVNVKTILEIV